MEIRKADIGDIPMMAKHGRYFHDISSYGNLMGYDEIRIQNNLMGLIESPVSTILTAWDDGIFMGMLAAIIINSLYDPKEYMAQCLFVAVLPDFQKKRVSAALITEFEKWGIANGAVLLAHSGYSDNFLKSMKRRGYQYVETVVMKKVGEVDEVSV